MGLLALYECAVCECQVMGARMRAPRRERSRGGGGCRAEQIAARAANAFKYALCTMHADRSANALRVVWYKGTGGRAERVVGGVAARVGVASERGR